MAEVGVFTSDGQKLTFDTDDVESVSSPRDYVTVEPPDGIGAVRHELTTAHLHIRFRPGKQPIWKPI